MQWRRPTPADPPGIPAEQALRRSLLVWGWGHLSAGERRGWLGPPAQLLAVALLVACLPLAGGVAAPLVFLLGAAVAANRFVHPPDTRTLESAWDSQDGALRNAVVRVVNAEPAVEADPNRRFHGLRWVDLGTAPDGARTLALEAARSERVRNLIVGVLPTTSQRLVPVERLGTATLRAVPVASGIGPFGPVVAWRIERIDLAGVAAGDG